MVAQPGTCRGSAETRQQETAQAWKSLMQDSLFPQGYPGSNPGHGVLFIKKKKQAKIYFLNHPFQDLGNPRKASKANGAAQLAHLSKKSQIGSPEIGLIKAVRNPQKAAQAKTTFNGLINTKKATNKSNIPIKGIKVVAVDSAIPTDAK